MNRLTYLIIPAFCLLTYGAKAQDTDFTGGGSDFVSDPASWDHGLPADGNNGIIATSGYLPSAPQSFDSNDGITITQTSGGDLVGGTINLANSATG